MQPVSASAMASVRIKRCFMGDGEMFHMEHCQRPVLVVGTVAPPDAVALLAVVAGPVGGLEPAPRDGASPGPSMAVADAVEDGLAGELQPVTAMTPITIRQTRKVADREGESRVM